MLFMNQQPGCTKKIASILEEYSGLSLEAKLDILEESIRQRTHICCKSCFVCMMKSEKLHMNW